MWQWLMTDVTTVAKDVLELSQSRPEKQVYMSLPRPGVRERKDDQLPIINLAAIRARLVRLSSDSCVACDVTRR